MLSKTYTTGGCCGNAEITKRNIIKGSPAQGSLRQNGFNGANAGDPLKKKLKKT